MKRLFWLGVGATIGVLVVRKATRTAEALTPQGLAASFSGLGDAVRDFAADVRAAMDEHERDLLAALGVDSDGDTGGPADDLARAPRVADAPLSTAPGRHSTRARRP